MKNCFIICFQSKPMTRSICTIRLINYQGSSLFIQIYQSSICNYTLWNFFPHHISTFSSNNILFTHQLFSIKFRRFLDIASINSNRHAVAYPLPLQVQMKSGNPTTKLFHFISITYYWNMSYIICINFIIIILIYQIIRIQKTLQTLHSLIHHEWNSTIRIPWPRCVDCATYIKEICRSSEIRA